MELTNEILSGIVIQVTLLLLNKVIIVEMVWIVEMVEIVKHSISSIGSIGFISSSL